MIRMEDLSFSTNPDKHAWILKDICLDSEPGECILVCGASGCGKTTLTRALNGLIPHFEKGWRAGRVLIGKKNSYKDVKDFKPYELARIIGSMFQDPRSQFFTTKVKDEVVWGCENLKYERKNILDRLEQALSLFHLEKLKNRNVFELSNGEKQRAVFASVWAMDPCIYVLDEPSSNLDPESIRNLSAILSLLKTAGHTIVIAEHRLYYLARIIDRMVVMKKGKIKACYRHKEISTFSGTTLDSLGLRRMNLGRLEFCSESQIKNAESSDSERDLVIDKLCLYHKKRGVPIIKNVSFTIVKGEVLGLCGPNGAGKTTLCRLIAGLSRQTSGHIWLGAMPLPAKKRLEICHLVFQQVDHQLFRSSVRQELSFVFRQKNPSFFAEDEIIEILNLGGLVDCHPQALSGGEKQRLALAVALMKSPEFLILDEPTSGMDADNMRNLSCLLKRVAAKGCAVVVVTHDAQFMTTTCSRAILFHQGQVKQDLMLPKDSLFQIRNEFTDYLVEGILPSG